jgi:hypothetical protein
MGLQVTYTDLRYVAVKKIENELKDTDYRVIKAMEKVLIEDGKLSKSFGEERDAKRAEINAIRAVLPPE